ncbi:hypothetical protein KSS87_019677 [Heliosperma pusillum]|nr:hypothetical protein KSS87_019677 [Heliosperma pusillum]
MAQDTWYKIREKMKRDPVRPPERPKLQHRIHGFRISRFRVRNDCKSPKHIIGSNNASTQTLSINGGESRVSACDKRFSGVTQFIEKIDKYLLSEGLIEHGKY